MALRFQAYAKGLLDGIDYRIDLYDTGKVTFEAKNPRYPIQSVATSSDTFNVDGRATSKLSAGDTFWISGRTGSVETWVVSSISYDSNLDLTAITVTGDITDGTDSGAVYATDTLTATDQWITWNAGESDDDGRRPLRPHEFTLSLVEGDNDFSVLRGVSEDNTRIEVYRTDTNTKVYQGFVAPNRIIRHPDGPTPHIVNLSGTEGLPLLEDKTVDTLSWSSNDKVTVMKGIRTILNELYSTSIPIEVGFNWWPAGGSLTSSDLALQSRHFKPDNLRENRPEGDWFDLLTALKELLKPFNLTVQQTRRSGVVWWMAAWDAYKSNGKIDTWLIQPGGGTTYQADEDVEVDLDSLSQDLIEPRPEEDGLRRRKRVSVTYDHPPVPSYFEDGEFEDTAGNLAWIFSTANVTNAGTVKHSNASKTPDPSADNKRTAILTYDSDSGNGNTVFPISQTKVSPALPEKDAFLRITLDHANNQNFASYIRAEVDGTYWGTSTEKIRADSLAGDVSLPVDTLQAPIAQGAKVPIFQNGVISSIKVNERIEKGADTISGQLKDEVPKGAEIIYIVPYGSSDFINPRIFIPSSQENEWKQQKFYLPAQDPSGNDLSGSSISIEFGLKKLNANKSFLNWWFDNALVQPVKGGQVLDQSVHEASTDEIGDTEEISVTFGSGPSFQSVSRIVGGRKWGVGPSPSPVYLLGELQARQRLRYFRQTNNQYTLTVHPRNKSPQISGHEIVKYNGDMHRVSSVESQPSEGQIQLSLLEHNDYGT